MGWSGERGPGRVRPANGRARCARERTVAPTADARLSNAHESRPSGTGDSAARGVRAERLTHVSQSPKGTAVDTRKLSRCTGAAILALAPIGFVVGAWTQPVYDNDAPAASQLAEVAAQPMPPAALRVLVSLLILLMPAAMIFATRLARRARPGSRRSAARSRSSPGPRGSPASAPSRACTGTARGWRTRAPSRP